MQEQMPTVAACYADDCEYNRSMRCHAPSIEVDPTGEEAFCATYEQESEES